jgi:hypothetical protein
MSTIYAGFPSKDNQCCIPDIDIDVTKLVCPFEDYNTEFGTCDTRNSWDTVANKLACLCCEGTIERYYEDYETPESSVLYCNVFTEIVSADDLGCCGGVCPESA